LDEMMGEWVGKGKVIDWVVEKAMCN
jgi:hypothetical protein